MVMETPQPNGSMASQPKVQQQQRTSRAAAEKREAKMKARRNPKQCKGNGVLKA